MCFFVSDYDLAIPKPTHAKRMCDVCFTTYPNSTEKHLTLTFRRYVDASTITLCCPSTNLSNKLQMSSARDKIQFFLDSVSSIIITPMLDSHVLSKSYSIMLLDLHPRFVCFFTYIQINNHQKSGIHKCRCCSKYMQCNHSLDPDEILFAIRFQQLQPEIKCLQRICNQTDPKQPTCHCLQKILTT